MYHVLVFHHADLFGCYKQGRFWAKPNETLTLGPQKFWKKLHRKKPLNFFLSPQIYQKNL